MWIHWRVRVGGTRKLGGRINDLGERVKKYIRDSKEYDEKWGKFEAMPVAARPLAMPQNAPEAPTELILYRQCKDFNCLLTEGGILDQPYWLWTLIQAVGAAVGYEEYRDMKIREMNAELLKL